MTHAKTVLILSASFGLAVLNLSCGSTRDRSGPAEEGNPGPLDGGVPDSGVPDSGVPDSGVPDSGVPDSGVPDGGCSDCPPPTCSIACIPHHIHMGQSTTFYWSSDGSACSLSCPGLGLQLDVPCIGQDSDDFQNLQETQECTFTATGPGGTVSCSDSVEVK